MKTPGSHWIRLLLAAWTVMTAATCDDNPFDDGAAHYARLTFTSIDPVLQLEESFAPFGINVVADRRSAQFDRLVQHFLDGRMEFAQLSTRERCSATARPDCGAEERLVRVDVSHAAQQPLVQQRTLDRGFKTAEKRKEALALRVQRLVTGSGESRGGLRFHSDYRQSSESPRVDETQLASRGQLQNRVSMFCHRSFWRCDQQASSHAEMHDPLPAHRRGPAPVSGRPLEVEDDVFADPPHALDAGTLQHRRESFRRRLQRLRFLAQPDRFDNVAGNTLVETASNGFDFGEFGHSIQFTASPRLSPRGVTVCAAPSRTCKICCYTARLTLISPNFGRSS